MTARADTHRAERRRPITATHQHGRRTQYRLKGGAWDGPDLDTMLRDAPVPRIGAPHDALVDGDIRLTAGDVNDLSAALAGGLRELGVRRRDAVAWQLPNGYEAMLLFRACWRLGAVAVPIEHHASAPEVDAVLAATTPAVVVGARHLPLGRRSGAVVVGGPTLPARRRSPDAATSGPAADPDAAAHPTSVRSTRSGAPFAKLLAAAPVATTDAKESDVAVVLFTRGTSGRALGVIHTHRTLAASARVLPEREGLSAADVVLAAAPLATVTGVLHGLLVPALLGMTTVLLPEWNPTIALDLVERERVSFLVGPPSALRALLREPSFSARRVRSVRLVTVTGDRVTPAFVERAAERFRARAKRVYGSTEAPLITGPSPADGPEAGHHTDGRTVGVAEMRVVDPVTGDDRPRGALGEVWLRGPELFAGYLDADDNGPAFARGGWFRTGDLGVLDQQDNVTVLGRLGDAPPTAGPEAVSSASGAAADPRVVAQVEDALQRHPAVDDAVVVTDGAGLGLVAFVTLAAAADRAGAGPSAVPADSLSLAEARTWLAQGAVSGAELVAVRVRKAMPVQAGGQVDRPALRASLAGPSPVSDSRA